eukprot:g13555.t1
MVATMKTSNRWLGLLRVAAVVSSVGVCAYSDSSSECIPGDCDSSNNRAECGYDSGDCCSCTCVDTTEYICGSTGFQCVDPDAPCVDDDDVTVERLENCDNYSIGNGYCDSENNNALCDYDGGDCCECTCSTEYTTWEGDESRLCSGYFACIDPDAPCVDDDDITVERVENCGFVAAIGNGFCNTENNKAECDYDGGDCCECTCSTENVTWDDDYVCGGVFQCIDPAAPCVDDDDVTADLVENCPNVAAIGNARCDAENNNPGCNYDGGDCCSCTCVDLLNRDCGGFSCVDPDAPCVNDDDITVDLVETCDTVSMSDAYCDERNNTPECNYDGGDCCSCTCVDRPNEECGRRSNFACIDPMAPCVDDDSVTVDMIDICDTRSMGDGYCNNDNNIAECAYDGGDCCSCTCDPAAAGDDSPGACQYGFACVDPNADCVNDDDITVEMFDACDWVPSIGNGYCDLDMNIPECNYDGGDCCECTCQIDEYGDDYYSDGRYSGCSHFACVDPEAPCVDEDLITIDMVESCDNALGIGDGYCHSGNNNELCLYDGGDCCSCTCEYEYDDDYPCSADGSGFDCKDPSVPCFGEENTKDDDFSYEDDDDYAMSYEFVPWEQDGPLPTVDDAVEVGTKTEVGVTAAAYDVRPGASSRDVGCGAEGGDGCSPTNSRDGIASEVESRWSCAPKLVIGEGPCQIEYTFAEPQDIVDILVAFWKGNERIRTLKVHLDGALTYTHESYAGSTFNTLGVSASGVSTVMLESVDLLPDEWLSLIEVLIFVTP